MRPGLWSERGRPRREHSVRIARPWPSDRKRFPSSDGH
jgi:hypothetical protein